jgi:hypothetical protein
VSVLSPIPTSAAVVYRDSLTLTEQFYTWLFELWLRVNGAASQLAGPSLLTPPQTAAIGSTALASAAGNGVFRVSYVTRIVVPATTSSGLTIGFNWTRNGVALSYSGVALTGNAVNSWQQGSFVARIDAGTLTYGTAYVSVGATPMTYELDIMVEQLR